MTTPLDAKLASLNATALEHLNAFLDWTSCAAHTTGTFQGAWLRSTNEGSVRAMLTAVFGEGWHVCVEGELESELRRLGVLERGAR
jgi:hypothetical protein